MSDTTRSDPSGFTSGLLVGLVLGAAGAHYLTQTEEGKKLLASIKEKAAEAMEDVKDNPAIIDKITELEKTMSAARATINEAAAKVVSATEPASKPSKKKCFFQKMGVSLKK